MIRTALIACITAAHCLAANEGNDLLRFTNGDQLHGNYQGIGLNQELIWQRDDIHQPANFNTAKLRHVMLSNGCPEHPVNTLSQVLLINGDRIPGTITSLDDSSITLDSPLVGTLTLPRNIITSMSPNPLGGRVHYYGPYSEDGWEIIQPRGANEPESPAIGEAASDETHEPTDNGPLWNHIGAAWYWHGEKEYMALIRRDSLPERSILRFQLAWKQRPTIAIGMNTDFKTDAPPAPPADDEEEAKKIPERFARSSYHNMPLTFGNGHVLRIQSNYMSLVRTRIDEKGNPSYDSLPISNNRLALDNSSQAEFEIRSDRSSGDMALFVDGSFVTQWNIYEGLESADEGNDDKPKSQVGYGFGFLPIMQDAGLRISDIVIADWNGNTDSARSQQSDDQDVVMLTNGLDRIAGKTEVISTDRELTLQSKHGTFVVPMDEVASVHFARHQLIEAPERSDNSLTLHFSPAGIISGLPISGDPDSIQINHPILGELKVETKSAVMIEFNTTSPFINAWDDNF